MIQGSLYPTEWLETADSQLQSAHQMYAVWLLDSMHCLVTQACTVWCLALTIVSTWYNKHLLSTLVKHPNIRIRIFVCRAPVFGFGFGFFCLYLDSDSDLRRVSVSRIRSDYLVSAAHIRYSYLFIWFWRVFVSRSRPDYLVSAAHIRYSYLFIILSAQIQ